jgi:hypothetical protein
MMFFKNKNAPPPNKATAPTIYIIFLFIIYLINFCYTSIRFYIT